MNEVTKPILFLDVDGPINAYEMLRKGLPGYTLHQTRPGPPWDDERHKPLPVLLNHNHGARLMELGADIVWCTKWREHANVWIGSHIGLPELPHVPFTEPYRNKTRLHVKLPALLAYAEGRPFVWVDDEASFDDWKHIQKEHGRHGEIHRASPRTGLMNADFYQIKKKLEEVSNVG